jgi:hypothetical protein
MKYSYYKIFFTHEIWTLSVRKENKLNTFQNKTQKYVFSSNRVGSK